MTREDRAKEAEEYRRAVTIEGWEYVTDLWYHDRDVNLGDLLNRYAKEGFRLHSLKWMDNIRDGKGVTRGFVCVFERRRDYERER